LRSIKRYLPSRPVIASVIVSLVVGGVGSATAASLITGKQIKNGSIQYSDLSKKAKKKLRGKRGKTGAAGVAGAKGDAGAKGAEGDPGSAVGYAFVTSAGPKDASRSTDNVTDVVRGGTGVYCIDLAFTPKLGVASAVHNGGDTGTIAEVIIPNQSGFCDAAHQEAEVVIHEPFNGGTGQGLRNSDFSVLFE
jgi:hypothetical protein